MARKTITVCGVKIPTHGLYPYGGGHIAPTARHLGTYALVSKASAQKLMAELFPHKRVPRPGTEVLLCERPTRYPGETARQYLSNRAGRFEVERRGVGEFEGAPRRRRRR